MFPFLGFVFFLLLLLLVLVAINSRVQRVTYEDSFSRGTVPSPLPTGPHKGAAHVLYGAKVGWLGKTFTASEQGGGVNVFSGTGQRLAAVLTPRYKKFATQPDGTVTAYEFRTSAGPSIKNANQQVLKLDYNFDANPGLIRVIFDEVVQIDPGRLLGKIYLQLLPGWFLTLGYFALQPAAVSTPASQQPATSPVQAQGALSEVTPVPAASSEAQAVPAEASVVPTPVASSPEPAAQVKPAEHPATSSSAAPSQQPVGDSPPHA